MLTSTQPKPLSKMQNKIDRLPDLPSTSKSQSQEVSPAVKIAIVGGFLLSLIAFVMAMMLSRTVVFEKNNRASLEASRVQMEDQIDALEQENSGLQTQLARLREQMKTYTVENAKLSKELDQTTIEISNARKKISILEDQNVNLNSQLEEAKAQAQSNALKSEPLPTMLAEPATVSEPVSGGSVESSEIQEVLPALAGGDLVKENASVMTVNRKFNFVVVNLGLKDNLKIGSQLAVVRDGKQIGVVQIEKLYDRFAAAAILNEAAKDKIEKGDEIRTL